MLSERSSTQKKVLTVLFYLHDILEQTKLIYSDRKQTRSCLAGTGMLSVLFWVLLPCAYTVVKIHLSEHPRTMHFTICSLYFNLKYVEGKGRIRMWTSLDYAQAIQCPAPLSADGLLVRPGKERAHPAHFPSPQPWDWGIGISKYWLGHLYSQPAE